MARNYCEYINVDHNFIPVFSREWDKKYPDRWRSFYPHETFKDILGDLASSLEMGSNESRKSLWVSGAYGTGKTFASFAIKHILEDTDEDIEEYFQIQNLPTTLLNRFKGIKSKGEILVIQRSSSSGITSDNLLFNAIQDSVKQALREKGYTYLGEKSLYENIVETLQDPDSVYNFSGAFNKYQTEYFPAYDTADQIVEELAKYDTDKSNILLPRIVEVMEKDGFNVARSAEDMADWIKDIIKGNNLYSIVFIWDEFSDYFRINQAITGLQELAQISFTTPFYFLLITHLNYSQFILDAEGRKRIEARFKIRKIAMADTTAFMLMGKVIAPNPSLAQEWSNLSQMLWERVNSMVKSTIGRHVADVKDDELKSLLPLHPYAAHILATISSSISSNQRTMFQFLSGDLGVENTKHNFSWYINTHSVEDWYFLTCDYIWDYFFVPDNVDLDDDIRGFITHYHTYEGQCENEDEKRLLKTTMLLSAMYQKTGYTRGRGALTLLRPLKSNIRAAYYGTPLADKVELIMNKFVQKGVVGSMAEGTDVLYVAQSKSIDMDRYNKLLAEVKGTTTFQKILDENNIAKRFSMSGYLEARFSDNGKQICATHLNLRVKLEGAKDWPKYKVPIIFMFAKSEEDIQKNRESIEKYLKATGRDMVILDMSSQPLGNNEWNNYVEHKAKARYFLNIDPNLVKLHETNASNVLSDWQNKLDISKLNLYVPSGSIYQVQGLVAFRNKMKDINKSLFSYGLELLTENDNIFKNTGFKDSVCKMGMDRADISANYNYLNTIKESLKKSNLWSSSNYWEANPANPVSQMKITLEKYIKGCFEEGSKVSISDIWHLLQEKPFGLINCSGSAFITGFLLKNYADTRYYRTDGSNTVPLNFEGLADMVFCAVKEMPKAANLYIVEMTPAQEIFCKITGEVFKIPESKQNSIQDIQHELRSYLSRNNFPLWSISHFVDGQEQSAFKDEIKKVIDYLCDFVAPQHKDGADDVQLAEEIAEVYQSNKLISQHLDSAVSPDNMKTGMILYIKSNKPELIETASRLGVTETTYLSDFRKELSVDSSWLWDKDEVGSKLDSLYLNYRLIEEIKRIVNSDISTLEGAANGIREKIGAIKMPYEFFKNECPTINPLFNLLIEIYKSGDFKNVNKNALINELNQKSDGFVMFYNTGLLDAFKSNTEKFLKKTITAEECNYLYSEMKSKNILTDLAVYLAELSGCYEKYEKGRKLKLLSDRWRSISSTESPAQWSYANKIPIICLFKNEIKEARAAFDIINKNYATDEKLIDTALEFLDESKEIQIIKDLEKCNEEFKVYISGDFTVLLSDLDKVKELLFKKLGTYVYDWWANKPQIETVIKEYCVNEYKTNYYNKVFEKIDQLSPDKAKEYLKDLIKNEPLVGIRIMEN